MKLIYFQQQKRRHKKILFSTKRMIQQQVFSEPSTLFDNGNLAPRWTKAADTRAKEKKNSNFVFMAANLR